MHRNFLSRYLSTAPRAPYRSANSTTDDKVLYLARACHALVEHHGSDIIPFLSLTYSPFHIGISTDSSGFSNPIPFIAQLQRPRVVLRTLPNRPHIRD